MADLSVVFDGQSFDANNIEPSQPRELLPPGNYIAQIIDSEMKETKTGGKMLKLSFEITEGQHARRRVWSNLNLVNSNATAVDIAQRDLSAICRAIGQLQLSDSDQLHYQPMQITVAIKPPQGIYEASNEVKGYAPCSGANPAAAAPMSRAAVVPATSAAGRTTAQPPWRRNA